ncbi:myosin-binding protein 7-like [Amaranthus tricolor]|uniref:myosin-binding protein 7-like n=1 Tax=Amaranthus tricolor TaxID=29722 RepID=UPI002587AA96|nr:myosin-binding protein 7-like [Amaranthus tricolor]
MDKDIVSFPFKSLEQCCDCGGSCSLTVSSSSNGAWIRSVKRKYDEFEKSGRYYIPGLETFPVARVGIENECKLLRETVGSQQATIQELCLELEEERNAASSATNETMSMILRLQNEKAEVLMEARQFKRFAEDKMSHDAQEISALEEVLYQKEQTIQSLTCKVQAYKHRMMSYGLSEFEAEGRKGNYSRNPSFSNDFDSSMCAYPKLRCDMYESQEQLELDDDNVDFEKYPFGEIPGGQDLKNLEYRINQMEGTPHSDQMNADFGSRNVSEKVVIGQSPRRSRHSQRFSTDSSTSLLCLARDMGPDNTMDSPRFGTSFKKLDCVAEELRKTDGASDFEDDMCDRVYTIDSIHHGAPYNNCMEPKAAAKFGDDYLSTPKSIGRGDLGDPDVKKLSLRLRALEADRESMRQTIMSMQTDKAQYMLLREIAQHLCRDMAPASNMPVQKPYIVRSFCFMALFKWILSVFWRKRARQSKYTFELKADNMGLRMLLDKSPRYKLWRCVSKTQVKKAEIAN